MKHLLFAYICLTIIDYSQQKEDDNQYRLPTNVVPEYYKLKIKTILDEDNFKHISSVGINIHCVEPTNKITLHVRNLTITCVKLYSLEDKHTLKITPYTDAKFDLLHIGLEEELEDDTRYRLKINFEGEISNKMSGLYRSSYTNEKGEKKWLATTYFEPTNARAAFPCFDEPALRAVFSIEITHEKNYVAISNMPLKSYSYKYIWSGKMKGSVVWVSDLFLDTPIMSTYLVAYTISEFAHISTPLSNKYGDTTLNVWAPQQSLYQLEYANEISPKIMDFYEEYFDVGYPLTKSDLIVIPDYATNAMENWGLIMVRKSEIQYMAGRSTLIDKYIITEYIAQEFAHYWFGNLVAIKWWTYLWMKAGFATYLSSMVVENLMPQWKVPYAVTRFLQHLYVVYEFDGLKNSRPMSIPIKNPDTIVELFSMTGLTASKSVCIIRMMEHFLGSDVLKNGISEYLKTNEYSSTDKNDLWGAFSTVINEENVLPENVTLSTIMNTWSEQSGFPLVTAIRNYSTGTVTLTQFKYMEIMKPGVGSCNWIPVSYTTEKESDFENTKPKLWLPCPRTTVEFTVDNAEEWLLLNMQLTGLYRVNYDETNWKLLIKQLNIDHEKINLLNRISLLEDVIELAMTNYVDFNIAFDLLKYISKETAYQVWRRLLEKLFTIRDFLYSLPQKELIEKYMGSLILPMYERLGGINSTKPFSRLDKVVIDTACKLYNQECKQGADQLFQKWIKSGGDYIIPQSIRAIVFCQGLKVGDEEAWELMWKKYLKTILPSEKNMILDALGCSNQPPLLDRYLSMITSNDSGLRQEDVQKVFESVITNELGFQTARIFFYENIEDIYNIMSPPGSQMVHFLPLVARSLKTVGDKQEFKQFVKTHMKYLSMARITLNQVLEKIFIWDKWYKVVYPKLTLVLENVVNGEEEPETIEKEETSTTTNKRKYRKKHRKVNRFHNMP